ncbi:MAG: 3'(2'),5'-bisphosphate nucleotidase CysQ, partial [Boseongicola sp.]|nr:3'(2'),5'-bisphosphate nucleotidase CysQ [Boseongicola sp.]
DKGGDDPVSEADFAVDTYLKTALLKARPDYGWVSEETEDDPARFAASRVFIVDPIDGTRAFVAGEKTWAHSLAVSENGRITAACVYLPVRDKLYLAAIGEGATLNGAQLTASAADALETANILTPRVTMQQRFWKGPVPSFQRHFRPSLAYRLALVGEGRFDAMLTLRPAWEWDIAAGALIATESGATVTDRRGQTLSFNSPSRQTSGVVTASEGLHPRIVEALARY